MTKKRDSAYWTARLKRSHPTIWARLKAGKLPSVRAACIEAGLIRPPTRFEALKREWNKASAAERGKFLKWALPATPPTAASASPPSLKMPAAPAPAATTTTIRPVSRRPSAASSWVDGGGYLRPAIAVVMKKAITDRRMTRGAVMKGMGFNALDPRLGLALQRRWRPTTEFLDKLPAWLRAAAVP